MQIRKITLLAAFSIALTIIVASAYASEPTEPHNADAMWIEPSVIDITGVSVGYRFNVTVWANASQETKGWQIWLYYPKAYINATRAGYTAGSKSEFFKDINVVGVAPIFRSINDTHIRFEYGESWIMGPYREPGYGSLCWIEFEVIALPPEGSLVEIPLDMQYAYTLVPPQTCLYNTQSQPITPLDIYNAIVVPELTVLAMLALLGLATPMVLYAYKKKR